MSELTREDLMKTAADLNTLYDDDPIQVNTRSTIAQLNADIAKVAAELEDGDQLFQSTVNALIELEIDVPAGIKIKKNVEAKAKAAPKPKGEAKAKDPKAPGVIATIAEIVQAKGPITKEGILAILVKKFPDKEENSMLSTIKVQLPTRMAKERNLKIISTDKGYMVK